MNIEVLVVLGTLTHFGGHEILKPITIFVIIVQDFSTLIMLNHEYVAARLDPAHFEEDLVALVDLGGDA